MVHRSLQHSQCNHWFMQRLHRLECGLQNLMSTTFPEPPVLCPVGAFLSRLASTAAGLVSSLCNYEHGCCVPQSSGTAHAQLFVGACHINTGQLFNRNCWPSDPFEEARCTCPKGAAMPLTCTAKNPEVHGLARLTAHLYMLCCAPMAQAQPHLSFHQSKLHT